jgi:alpha/beta superfamily hydrolase
MPEVFEEGVTFPAAGRPTFLLEGRLARIPGQTESLHPAVVLCHAQPATSSLDEPLLQRLADDIAAAGMLALRINFRGVGHSQGAQTDGRLEPLDVAGAVDFILGQPGVDPEKLALIGHAFGAYIVLAYAEHDARVRTVVAISPPTLRLTADLGQFERPKLFVTGEYDEVSPRHKLEPWIATLPGGCGLRVIGGARHLLRGYETITSETILRYLTRWAAAPNI